MFRFHLHKLPFKSCLGVVAPQYVAPLAAVNIGNRINHSTNARSLPVNCEISHLLVKSSTPRRTYSVSVKREPYDAIIVGGGHNGLVCASYLAKQQKRVLVLERRPILGGAAVSEELYPGFTFSRASYLCSLLRPQIIQELELKKYGLEFLERKPASFTPLRDGSDHLMLGMSPEEDYRQIAKFLKEDAENYIKYQQYLEKYSIGLEKLVDLPPFDPASDDNLFTQRDSLVALMREGLKVGVKEASEFSDILLSPASKILRRWFKSDVLKATLSTDAVIGEFSSPETPGSAYVLLHHVFNDLGFGRGVWAYVRGGMGSISQACAASALANGAEIRTNQHVRSVLLDSRDNSAKGVVLQDGTEIESKCVISGSSPDMSFLRLIHDSYPEALPDDFRQRIESINYNSATFKINLAVDKLPNFKAMPHKGNTPGLQHRGTIHFEESIEEIHESYSQAYTSKLPSKRPMIEMTIPSAVDRTIAPEGKHVVQLFTQYAPYHLADGHSWDDPGRREAYAQSVYKVIEEYCPGFTDSILYEDLLSPLDLERTFQLKGGSIFHGSISLDQLYWQRPAKKWSRHTTPIPNYYLAASGGHPGGGVMGSCGRNCAGVVLSKQKF